MTNRRAIRLFIASAAGLIGALIISNSRPKPISQERVDELLAIVSTTSTPYAAEDVNSEAPAVPLGTAGAVGDRWSVVVNSVDLEPAEGSQAGAATIVVNLTATNVDDAEVSGLFSLEINDGTTTVEADWSNTTGPIFQRIVTVSPGDSVSGNVAFQIDSNDARNGDDLTITIADMLARTPPAYFATQ